LQEVTRDIRAIYKSRHWSKERLAAAESGEMKSLLISIKVVSSVILFPSKTAFLNQLGSGFFQTGGKVGRKPRVDRTPEEKRQSVREAMKSGIAAEM
jgi:hypothetical protein